MPPGENNRKLRADDVDVIVRRYTTPLPNGTWVGTSTLAREFGVRPATINRWLRIRGIRIRSAREAHSGGKRCKPIKNLPRGEAPACKCGCGAAVAWNRRKNRWNLYAVGHYPQAHGASRLAEEARPRRQPTYALRDWLYQRYVVEGRSLAEMAAEQGVSASTIATHMQRVGLPRRKGTHSRDGTARTGPLNPAWKGGVAKWSYSADWKRLAKSIRDRDEWTCQDCGEQRSHWGTSLHVHHIDGNKLNNDPTNLISLCARCHRRGHRHERSALA